ncbi:hypothetical protein HPB52_003955 [Rhipicephalus sanguineus]|uniref:Uncharacterized protein n=1 Tax=Rhipicephalus sanguineus TaxID=34632 RepID=A0A9D4PCJ8_RHISA|nr:hypothetical protein HPB52_003955 [Rhipicephalus sanguineus]
MWAQRRRDPLKNSPGGTLNSIRRGSQVEDEHRAWPRLVDGTRCGPGRKNGPGRNPSQGRPGGTLNSIRRGSQVEDEHRGVAQARGRHPGVDPVGRTARDETRAKDGRPVTGAGARPSSGGRDDGEAGTEPELHALSSSSSSVFAAQPLLPPRSSCLFVARAPRAPFFIGPARRSSSRGARALQIRHRTPSTTRRRRLFTVLLPQMACP